MSSYMFLGQRTIRLITWPSANSGYLRRYDQPKLNQIYFFLLCDEHINIHTTSPHDCGDDNDDNDMTAA